MCWRMFEAGSWCRQGLSIVIDAQSNIGLRFAPRGINYLEIAQDLTLWGVSSYRLRTWMLTSPSLLRIPLDLKRSLEEKYQHSTMHFIGVNLAGSIRGCFLA